jgi:large subunit ribosomal protein L6
MSRLGKQPVTVPSGVTVSISGRTVTVSKGEKRLQMEHRPEVAVAWNEDEKSIVVSIVDAFQGNRQARAYWGMTRALLANMVKGVVDGYQRQLEVVGVGYNATVAGPNLQLKIGFANTVAVPIPQGVDVVVERQIVTIKGIDKQAVNEFAARVRAKRPPEPYNGKGIKYLNETIRRKQGKAFGS